MHEYSRVLQVPLFFISTSDISRLIYKIDFSILLNLKFWTVRFFRTIYESEGVEFSFPLPDPDSLKES